MQVTTLTPIPASVLDPKTGEPRYGSYEGGFREVNLSSLAGRVTRTLRHKDWLYAAIVTEDALFAFSVVGLGYAAKAFAFLYDSTARGMVVDATTLGPPWAARVAPPRAEGEIAAFHAGKWSIDVTHDRGSMRVRVAIPDLDADVSLDTSVASKSITAVAPVPSGVVDVTEKRALLPASGEIRAKGRTFRADGGFGGYDFTRGILARHTAWKWAFAMGRAKSGEPLAINLTEGFIGDAECAAWLGDSLVRLPAGTFSFGEPLDPWHITEKSGAMDLAFDPGAMHEENDNLLVARAYFVQPAGLWSGRVRILDRDVAFEKILGVAEDQDVLW